MHFLFAGLHLPSLLGQSKSEPQWKETNWSVKYYYNFFFLFGHFLFFLPLSPFPSPHSSILGLPRHPPSLPFWFTLLLLTVSSLLPLSPHTLSLIPGQASERDWGASVGQRLWPVHRTVEQAGREEGRGKHHCHQLQP